MILNYNLGLRFVYDEIAFAFNKTLAWWYYVKPEPEIFTAWERWVLCPFSTWIVRPAANGIQNYSQSFARFLIEKCDWMRFTIPLGCKSDSDFIFESVTLSP